MAKFNRHRQDLVFQANEPSFLRKLRSGLNPAQKDSDTPVWDDEEQKRDDKDDEAPIIVAPNPSGKLSQAEIDSFMGNSNTSGDIVGGVLDKPVKKKSDGVSIGKSNVKKKLEKLGGKNVKLGTDDSKVRKDSVKSSITKKNKSLLSFDGD
ncbi:hypothetical protein HK098_005923 [Nowakowskiella sp. JEL0407]|nr:hypothetical protein HK098_005923 [Nowakowskiella sp. JEL0407]